MSNFGQKAPDTALRLTSRDRFVLAAALSYAFSNRDDLNESLTPYGIDDGNSISVMGKDGNVVGAGLIEDEINALYKKIAGTSLT